MRRVFRQLVLVWVIGVLIANVVGGIVAPRFVRAGETELTTSLLRAASSVALLYVGGRMSSHCMKDRDVIEQYD